jgi:hypothetical protein
VRRAACGVGCAQLFSNYIFLFLSFFNVVINFVQIRFDALPNLALISPAINDKISDLKVCVLRSYAQLYALR